MRFRSIRRYVVDGDLHENGKLVLGESIADLGGLTIAYARTKNWLQGQAAAPDKDGLYSRAAFLPGGHKSGAPMSGSNLRG